MLTPELQKDDIFGNLTFTTLGTAFGVALDKIPEAVLAGIKRTTQGLRWITAVGAKFINGGGEDDDDGINIDANEIFNAMRQYAFKSKSILNKW